MQIMKSTKCSAVFRPLLTTLASVAIFASIASSNAFASGGSDECADMDCNSFFAPEVIESPTETPFFRTYRDFYRANEDTVNPIELVSTLNLGEWMEYLEQKISEENISYLIYKMSLKDLGNLTLAMEGKPATLTPEASALKTALLKVSKQANVIQALYYLGFAKRAEPIATRRISENWWDTPDTSHDVEDAKAAALLLANVDSMIKLTSDPFLVNRYRFQMIRLQFYSKQYVAAQQTYAAHIGDFAAEDSLKYRFMEFGAGALYKDMKFGKANYLYSLIFRKFAPFKKRAYRSFQPQEQADWLEALALAKNVQEQEVLWQMLGIKVDGLAGIAKIYELNPKSQLLPLLLAREVNAAEEDWTANEERKFSRFDSTTDGIKTDLEATGAKRIDALGAIADAGNTYKPHLWNLAMAHLYTLSGDLALADDYLNKAKSSIAASEIVQDQIRLTTLFGKVRSLKLVNSWSEDFLAKELTWIKSYTKDQLAYEHYRATTLNHWSLKTLGRLYQSQGDTVRALMLKDQPSSDTYRDNSQIDLVLAFLSKTGDSAFDTFLKKNYPYAASDLQEVRSLNLLYSGNIQAALTNLKLAGEEVSTRALNADPFMIHIKDCHDCDFEASHRKYTKFSFVTRMLDQYLKAQGTGEAAALASFQLANGFYNMTYYGNGRDIYQTKFGNLEPYSSYSRWEAGDHSKDRSLNMDMAEKYYQLAVEKSIDKEFKAKATFMSAKAEQNRYYYTHGQTGDDTSGDIHPGKYYRQLVSTYYDTQYYKEILKECGFFKTYADKHN